MIIELTDMETKTRKLIGIGIYHDDYDDAFIVFETTQKLWEKFSRDDFHLNVCKFVRPNHVQTDKHWRKNWRACKI